MAGRGACALAPACHRVGGGSRAEGAGLPIGMSEEHGVVRIFADQRCTLASRLASCALVGQRASAQHQKVSDE